MAIKLKEQFLTPPFTVSFPSVFTCATAPNGELTNKYELTMLFEHDTGEKKEVLKSMQAFLLRNIAEAYGDKVPPVAS